MNFENFINIRQTQGFSDFLKFFKWETISSKKNTFYYLRRVPILGSIMKIEKINVKNIDLKEIDEIARKNKTAFVKIEPFADESQQEKLDKLFFEYGYKHDTWPLSSTTTYIIDLQKSYEDIVANFKSKFRYNLRLSTRNGIRVKITNGKELLANCHSECNEESSQEDPSASTTLSLRMTEDNILRQFTEIYNNRAKEIKSEKHSYEELLHMCKNYGEKLWLLYCNNNVGAGLAPALGRRQASPLQNKIIMGAIFLQTDDILHYWHNGSTKEGRSLFAPTLIIAEGIKLGQKLNCKIFDFEGIYDERFNEQTKRWKGFTKFKEGFNGEKIISAWPYIKYYSPILKFFHFFKMI